MAEGKKSGIAALLRGGQTPSTHEPHFIAWLQERRSLLAAEEAPDVSLRARATLIRRNAS